MLRSGGPDFIGNHTRHLEAASGKRARGEAISKFLIYSYPHAQTDIIFFLKKGTSKTKIPANFTPAPVKTILA